MQRLGGGGYTRKMKRGGGNDPTCGCDMQVGWPKFLTDNIPLPSGQKGGGTCGAPPIPNYYQGGSQRGGGCAACSGLPLPQPMTGGGQPAAYNSNPVPDACPFPGTGYCGFYARGGAEGNNQNAHVPISRPLKSESELYIMLRGYQDMLRRGAERIPSLDNYIKVAAQLRKEGVSPVNEAAIIERMEVSGSQNERLSTGYAPGAGPLRSSAQPIGSAAAQEGGANYGEPMYLQARLRGGAVPRISAAERERNELIRNVARQLRKETGQPPSLLNIARRIREIRQRLPVAQSIASVPVQAQGIATVPGQAQSAAPVQVQAPAASQEGGGCGCGLRRGGYRPTKKNLAALKKWRKGQSIGFTMTSSLKAKGLIPRTSRKHKGKKVVSAKYK